MLDRVRWRRTGLEAAEAPVFLIGGLLLAWVLQATVDRHLELSLSVRRLLLFLDGTFVFGLVYFYALLPVQRLLSQREAALLIESREPRFRTSLISAYDLTASAESAAPESRALVAQLLADVTAEAGKSDIAAALFRPDRLRRLFTILGGVVLAVGVLFFMNRPVSGILVKRLFLSEVALPSDTRVVSLTQDLRIDPGMDATLSARAEGTVPSKGRLIVSYPNGQTDVVEVGPAPEDPAVFTHVARNVRGTFNYHFELNDGVGAEHRVTVVIPPSLKEIRFTQVYPAYTGLPETRLPPSSLRLLQGAKVRIDATSSIPLSSAVLEIKGEGATHALTPTGDPAVTLATELTVPAKGWTAFSLHLKSTDDTPSVNDPVYRVEIVTDQPPMVALLQPKKDRLSLLPRDKISLGFRATDDFGLKRLTLQYRVFRPGLSELSEATEKGSIAVDFPSGEKSVVQKLDWDLGRLVPPLTPGCRVTCWLEGEDNNTVSGPSLSRSIEKLVDVVSEEQKRLELLELLGERAKAIEKLYDMQRATNEKTDQSIR